MRCCGKKRKKEKHFSGPFGTGKQGDHACSINCLAFEMNDLLYGEVWDSIDAKDSYFILLGILALRLYLDSSWGMSRRGRRDVEEDIVRMTFRGLEIRDLEILGKGSWT
jgi:hypothetical protein